MKRLPFMVSALAVFALFFLYLPLMAVAVFSVNATKYGLVWKGFTLDWYLRLFENDMILAAAWNTLALAGASTLAATLIGSALAIGMERFPWPAASGKWMDLVLHVPVVIPDIIMAAALVIVFSLLRGIFSLFEPGLLNMIIGHVTFQSAFVALVVRSRLAVLGPEIEEAACDLFATPAYILRKVTLPLLAPGIAAGAMLAFTLSLDDFVISFFTAGPESVTLPLYIFAAVRRGVTPEIHALSTLVLLATAILVVGAERATRRRIKPAGGLK
ncbi:Spermidine/putrescine transport system permease protein PotC [Candidatus Desulfarcum epimagneticum]|uniref:Spermidine/putrescine transport system permease protein PotC n=1 Tax=uncultured Desulfobacteraceae bacterium TaxID=218296 RepID=A0A484HE59_9BACT|nr:Spermidine/putrescine transport system permease protein PotC [uncultured Desulfobacteraceae bacterium]